jgi:hypothetical protein
MIILQMKITFFFLLCSTGAQTQGLTDDRQAYILGPQTVLKVFLSAS